MNETLDDMVNYYGINEDWACSSEIGPAELDELLEGCGKIALAIPKSLIRELVELQKDIELGLGEMLTKAIRQFVDRERRGDEQTCELMT